MRSRLLWIRLLSVVALVLLAIRIERGRSSVQWLAFPFVKPGVSVLLVNDHPRDHPTVTFDRLCIRESSWRPFRELTRLEDLQGLVTIANERDALAFVRLRTSPHMYLLVAGTDEFEVLRYRDYLALPSYGIGARFGCNAGDGYMGVISDTAFARGHFQGATVKRAPGGFAIERWTYAPRWNEQTQHYVHVVRLIRETVGRDGTYARQVLVEKPAPSLPETKWDWPGLIL